MTADKLYQAQATKTLIHIGSPPARTLEYRKPTWLLGVAFSFESLFVLFLFAGRYKNDPRLDWIHVDLTALFFGLSVIVGLYIFLRRGFKVQRHAFALVMVFATFAAYAGFSLIWTSGDDYATQKAFYIATLTFWPLIATAVIIAPDTRRLHRLLLVLVLFSSWIGLEAFLNYLQLGEIGFVTALGGNYLGIGRVLGIGAIAALAYSLFFARIRLLKAVSLALCGSFIILLFVVGGRGPLLATVPAALVPLLAGWHFSFTRGIRLRRYVPLLVTIIGMGVALATYLIETGSLTTTLARMLILFEPGGGDSAGLRYYYYTSSIPLWAENPIFGHGIGSWSALMSPSDISEYPHNIFLEVTVELGLIGLSLFVTLLVLGWRALGPWRSIRNNPAQIFIVMLFVNTLANALVSGDIPDNRVLFAMLGLMIFTEKRSADRA